MKCYVTTRFLAKEELVEAIKKLQDAGHTVTTHWQKHGEIRPFNEHLKEAEAYASENIKDILQSEVFILLSNSAVEGGRGVYVDLGTALAMWEKDKKYQVFVVGLKDVHHSMYFLHPAVKRVESVDELLKVLK